MKATATFDVTDWNPSPPYDEQSQGPALTRISISKAFSGDLDGKSTGEGLFCGMNDTGAGAGYVVSERVTGMLGGKKGTFVMQHGGILGPGTAPRTFGNIVPGSGTGDLAGLRGEVSIDADEKGVHTLVLDYDFK